MSFEKFLRLAYYQDSNEKTLDSWKNHIIFQDLFVEYLCADKEIDWQKCAAILDSWKTKVEKEIQTDINNNRMKLSSKSKEEILNHEEIEEIQNAIKDYLKKEEIFNQQFNQAVKLFVIAEFTNFLKKGRKNDKEEFVEIFNREKKIFSETIVNGSLRNFQSSINTQMEIKLSEEVLTCAVFYSNSIFLESCEIPIVSASNLGKDKDKDKDKDKGQIYLLELKKVWGCGEAKKNPFYFPNSGDFVKDLDEDFQNTIQDALIANFITWNNEITQISDKLNYLKGIQVKSLADDIELRESEKVLEFMKKQGNINRFGIVWNVKSYDSETTELPIEGDSIGLASLTGIYHALRGNFPDNRVIFSVALEKSENDKITGNFDKVDLETIVAKVESAVNTNLIDTFVMHKDNFDFKKNELENLLKRANNFQIKIIDSKGNFVDTFPKNLEKTTT